jgi:hypothetical protein
VNPQRILQNRDGSNLHWDGAIVKRELDDGRLCRIRQSPTVSGLVAH